MKKRVYSVFFIFLFIIAASAQKASAHTLKIDGTMSATMHIEPHDSPALNTPALIHFDVFDKTKTFTVSGCDCTVTLKKDGKVYLTEALPQESAVPYTFTEKGTYTLNLSGTPRKENTFSAFTLTYSVPVGIAAANTSGAMNMAMGRFNHFSLNILLIISLVVAIAIIYITEKRKVRLQNESR